MLGVEVQKITANVGLYKERAEQVPVHYYFDTLYT
jgi:hypothetical protein